jgi:hypothetical protein
MKDTEMNRNHLILFLLVLANVFVWAADSTYELDTSTFPKTMTFSSPGALYDIDTQYLFWSKVDTTRTVSRVICELDATGNDVAGDIKHCTNFQTLAGATLINDFDTTSGVRDDSSITAGEIPPDSYVYIQWDLKPNAAITQQHLKVYYD